jgi:predicted transcriptional regulator
LLLEKKKRSRLEVVFDILCVVRDHGRQIKVTPLIRHSGLSPQSFSRYFAKLLERGFLEEKAEGDSRIIVLTEKGASYIREYMAVLRFVREFELDEI